MPWCCLGRATPEPGPRAPVHALHSASRCLVPLNTKGWWPWCAYSGTAGGKQVKVSFLPLPCPMLLGLHVLGPQNSRAASLPEPSLCACGSQLHEDVCSLLTSLCCKVAELAPRPQTHKGFRSCMDVRPCPGPLWCLQKQTS